MNGIWDGYARYIREDGSYYIGLVRNGKKNGKGTSYNKDGSVCQKGNWIDDNFQEI